MGKGYQNQVKYINLREITPEEIRCVLMQCPAIYEGVREITPEEMRCGAAACSAIYESIREVTPKEIDCAWAACHSIYEGAREGEQVYLIIGKVVNSSEIPGELEKKIGEGEALIEVPRALIDNIGK